MPLGKLPHVRAALLIGGAACLPLVAALAATPVEDLSTRDVRSPVPFSTPQPVLPDELKPRLDGAAAGNPYSEATGARTAELPNRQPGQPQAQPLSQIEPQRGGQNAQLFYDLQQLQSEVLQLRGLLEDQAFEIQRLRELQRSQYLDIDRRLTGTDAPGIDAVAGATQQAELPVATPTAPSASLGNVSEVAITSPRRPEPIVVDTAEREAVEVQTGDRDNTATPISRTVPNPVAAAPSSPAVQLASPEEEAYSRAFELMKNQQFEQSIVAYQGVIETFPEGTYAPESRYWLGELYLMSDRLEDARGSFNQVVDRFPAHQKVPLSLYKLGVVNHRLGVTPKALQYLDDVVVRYPDTPAAGLARNYALTYAAELR